MAKKEVNKGIIELKQEELAEIQEQMDENVRQYKALWEQRNTSLDAGEVMKAKELEGKYYYLRDVVGKQLDRKRIEIDTEIEKLQGEVFQLKRNMATNTKVLDRQKHELERLKKNTRTNWRISSSPF